MCQVSLHSLGRWFTFSNLLTCIFICYAVSTLRNLFALSATSDANLFNSDGTVKPLLFPLWGLAANGLSLSVSLTATSKRQGAKAESIELFSTHGLSTLDISTTNTFDFALRIDLLRNQTSQEFIGISVTCEPDAAGDIAVHCLELAALHHASRVIVNDSSNHIDHIASVSLLDNAAAGATSLLRRGVIPSAMTSLARTFGLAPPSLVLDKGTPIISFEVSKSAARVARAIAQGNKVTLDSVIQWTTSDHAIKNHTDTTAPPSPSSSSSLFTLTYTYVTRIFGLNKDADERAAATMRVTNDALVTAHTQMDEIPHDFKTLFSRVSLIDPLAFAPLKVRRFLWQDVLGETHTLLPRILGLLVAAAPLNDSDDVVFSTTGKKVVTANAGDLVPHWLGQVDLRLLSDPRAFPRDELPPVVANTLRVVGWPSGEKVAGVDIDTRRRALVPAFIANPVRPTRDAAVPVNITTDHIPLRLTLAPMSIGVWRLMSAMDSSISTQHKMGATERDTDDVIRLLSDTPGWLLGLTFAVAFIHLLFDVLALKNDVTFWASASSLKGISVRSLGAQCLSNIIITAFLAREGSSLLVTVPQAALAGLDGWKMLRAAGASLVWPKGSWFPSAHWDREFAASAVSGEAGRHDAEAVGTMVTITIPLLIGAALRSLLYDTHASWVDWLLGVAVGAVYTFGFALMTPQLWINYRLKSVAHLPWSVLGYRFINTIIDDVFAAVVKMPLLHRVSVFRDDVIFIIYMIQRRIYQVDRSRPAEGFEEVGGGEGEGVVMGKEDKWRRRKR